MKALWTSIGVIVLLVILGYGGYRLYHHFHYAHAVVMTNSRKLKTQPTAVMAQTANYIKMMPYKGFSKKIITDTKGMTLYVYANDKQGMSNCNGVCAKLWPPYSAKSQTGTFPANLTVIKRSDGMLQYAWRGMPLYYYSKDTKPGEIKGNGFKGLWSVAE